MIQNWLLIVLGSIALATAALSPLAVPGYRGSTSAKRPPDA